jgi:hypothetical protein
MSPRSKALALGIVSMLSVAGCSAVTDDGAVSDDAELKRRKPQACSVAVVGATINPIALSTSLGDQAWDGPPFGPAAVDFVKQIVNSAAPQFEIATNLAAMVLKGLISASQPPDVRGFVGVNGISGVQLLDTVNNSHSPVWPAAFWEHVALDGSQAMVIRLEDVDTNDPLGFDPNDEIGVVTLTAEDFTTALRAGGTLQVPVASRTFGKVLFVGIVVRPD